MPRDIKRIAYALQEYIRELDHEAFERVSKGAWITESLGTEEFLRKPDEEVISALAKRLPEENLTVEPWLSSLLKIARDWAKLNFYANMAWPDSLVRLYEKHRNISP